MIISFKPGDKLEMKKKHPCGGNEFLVLFAGSDVKVRCLLCGHEMIVPRVKFEKNIKTVLHGDTND